MHRGPTPGCPPSHSSWGWAETKRTRRGRSTLVYFHTPGRGGGDASRRCRQEPDVHLQARPSSRFLEKGQSRVFCPIQGLPWRCQENGPHSGRSVWTLVLGAECISEPGAQVRCEQTTAGLFPSGPGCPRRRAGRPRRQAGRPRRRARAATETGRGAHGDEAGRPRRRAGRPRRWAGRPRGWAGLGAAWSAGTGQLAPFANWLHLCLSPSTL